MESRKAVLMSAVKNGLVDRVGEGEDGTDWESCADTYTLSCVKSGFPGGSDGKESACNAGDLSLIPGWRRSPGEGKSYPLQYSDLENPLAEEPGRPYSMRLQRVGSERIWKHYWIDKRKGDIILSFWPHLIIDLLPLYLNCIILFKNYTVSHFKGLSYFKLFWKYSKIFNLSHSLFASQQSNPKLFIKVLQVWDFPGGPAFKHPPSITADVSSTPGRETEIPQATERLSLRDSN